MKDIVVPKLLKSLLVEASVLICLFVSCTKTRVPKSQVGFHDVSWDDPTYACEVALNDEYFVQRKLYPNVDYYSGIMLRALGIPTSMFTAPRLR